jgi:hypothetical protein
MSLNFQAPSRRLRRTNLTPQEKRFVRAAGLTGSQLRQLDIRRSSVQSAIQARAGGSLSLRRPKVSLSESVTAETTSSDSRLKGTNVPTVESTRDTDA